MSFKDKVVIVTGASSGIGAATAIKFASKGAKVVIVGRQVDKLKITSDKCENSGSKPLTIVADLTKVEDVKRIVNDTISHYGKLDILINNAGKLRLLSVFAEDFLEVFDDVIATNLRPVVYLTNLTAPHLVKTKGNIVNISSVAGVGLVGHDLSIYGTSKAGLIHFTKSVALELAGKGVRVNVINPGPVKTDIIVNMGVDRAYQENVWNTVEKTTPLGRISSSEDIAELVLFLASDKAKSITGSSYVVDNGSLLMGVVSHNV